MIIIADFNTFPAWTSTDPVHCGDPTIEVRSRELLDDMHDAFATAVEAAVRRYAWIDHWQFWNEPDIWGHLGGETYLRNLRVLYDIAHRVNPETQVAISSLAGMLYIGWLWNVSDAWYGSGKQPWDAMAHHPYNIDGVLEPDGHPMPIRFDRIQELHQLAIDKGPPNMKLWITECGWDNNETTDAGNLTEAIDGMQAQP